MNNVFRYDIRIRKTWINKDEKASKRTIEEELKQETATMTKEAEQMAADNELLNKMNKSLEKSLGFKRKLDTVKRRFERQSEDE